MSKQSVAELGWDLGVKLVIERERVSTIHQKKMPVARLINLSAKRSPSYSTN